MTDSAELIERGLQAWARGDLDALEAILDPQVTLTWVEPGPWDCTNRDEVMRLLRQRQAERGFGPSHPVQVRRVDDRTYLVSTERSVGPEPFPVATEVRVAHGAIVALRQHRTPAAGT